MKKTMRSLIESGQPFIGTFMQLPSVELTEMFAYSGFDFLIIDMEHGLIDYQQAVAMTRACENFGAAAMVRVPEVDEDKIKHALDMGASAILVAGVHSYQDALDAVRFAKYAPLGSRGACPAVRANHYGLDDHFTCYERMNKETVVFVGLEGPEVIADIERIAKIEGIDILGGGPVDLSVALGYPNQLEHPAVLEAIRNVKRIANENGKLYAAFSESIDAFVESDEKEDFYMLAGDNWLIGDVLKRLSEEMNLLREKKKR